MKKLTTLDLIFYAFCLTAVITFIYARKRPRLHLPPGPAGHFLIGNVLQLPTEYQWRTFAEWGKKYGDLFYIHFLGRPVIVCNSAERARDLLEKRSRNYSSRTRIRSGEELGMNGMMTLLEYGEKWKRQRRMMQTSFGRQESMDLRPGIQEEVERFVTTVCDFEGDIRGSVHRLVASALCLAAYGHKVTSPDDEIITLMEGVDDVCKAIGSPGSALVDIYPLLRFVPAWFPWPSFPRDFAKGRALVSEVSRVSVSLVRKELENGTSRKGCIPGLLEYFDGKKAKEPEIGEDIAQIGLAAFFAGFETTESTMYTFFLMMVLHPNVASRAQDELDRFIESNGKLPSFEDRGKLVFIECILKEVYRFHPPVPVGIPHRCAEEDTYQKWTIPGDSMIMTNIWQMMRDEQYFHDPEQFRPERYLDANKDRTTGELVYDPGKLVFGFGRRVCPGRYFADDLVWFSIVSVLAVYNILPSIHPVTGTPVIPCVEFYSSAISTAKPYRCRVVPRNEACRVHLRTIANSNADG